MIYDFNSCYSPANPYNIEINQTYEYANPGCTSAEGTLCVVVPGFTSGFVKMHVVPYTPKISEEKAKDITIYPNPTNNMINISTTQEIQNMEIFSVTGQKISEHGSDVTTIDISALPYGMYQIVCNFKDGSQSTHSFTKL